MLFNRFASVSLTLVATSLTVSCATRPSALVTDAEELAADEAVLLVQFHAVQANGLLTVHHVRISPPYAAFVIRPNEQLKVIKIKAADGLRISTYKVGSKMAYFDNAKMNFNVRPHTITYIGDVFVDEQRTYVSLRVVDNEMPTKALASSAYPRLIARYAYAKVIPSDRQ